MEYDMDIFINNELTNIKLDQDAKIGEGKYGHVFYFQTKSNGPCIIKISKCEGGDFSFENYIYYKYHKSPQKINSIPECYGSGGVTNKCDNKEYNYIILQYAGFITFKKFMELIILSKKNINNEMKEIIRIIYATGLKFIKSLHDHDIVCRDIKHDNIIVSDYLLSYYINNINGDITQHIPSYIINNIPVKVTYSDITDYYVSSKHKNIIQFIDVGLFCDLNILTEKKEFDKNDDKCNADFCDLDPFDPLFAATMPFISPFAIFNLSSIINTRQIEHKRYMIDIIKCTMKMSDLWSYNVIFVYFFYNFIGNYHSALESSSCEIFSLFKEKYKTTPYVHMLLYDVSLKNKIKRIQIKDGILERINRFDFGVNNFMTDYFVKIVDIIQHLFSYTHSDNAYLPFCIQFKNQQLEVFCDKIKFTMNKINGENEDYSNQIHLELAQEISQS